MNKIKKKCIDLLRRHWPLLAGFAIFAAAQILAHLVPHACNG